MALHSVNGIRLNVEVVGSGPPILMLHGFTGDLTTWDRVARALQDRYTTLRVDLIGHGGSDAPGNEARYSMECCVDDLIALVDKLGVAQAVWMGYSMGGRVALCMATRAPERCRALILEGASGGMNDSREREARVRTDRALAMRIETLGVASFVDYWESQKLFESQGRLDMETRSNLRRQRLSNRAPGLANSLRGMGTGAQPSVYCRLPNFDKPALFLAGEEDVKFSRLARTMSGMCPEGRYSVVPQAGHCAHLENPQGFLAGINEFLDSVSDASAAEPAPQARGRTVV